MSQVKQAAAALHIDRSIISLHKTIVSYFKGVNFGWGDHLPRCSVWIDRCFPDFHALNFAAAGTIYGQDYRGRRVRWTTPVAWWTQPGRPYAYGCDSGESWDHFYVTLRGPRVRAMFQGGLLPAGRAWCAPVQHPDEMRRAFLDLLDLMRRGSSAYPRAVHRLEELFLLLHPDVHPARDTRRTRLHELAGKIRLAPQEDWDMNREAARLGLSAVHFRRLFRQELGAPGHHYLLQARLDHAARLLRLTDRPVKEVAAACGIPDVFYFTRLFSARIGTSPARYRRHAGLMPHPTARDRA